MKDVYAIAQVEATGTNAAAVMGLDLIPEPWMQEALCAETDPEAFFPEKGGSTRDAKRVCRLCDVTEQCLAYALRTDQRFGIWGAKSERERRKMKKGRAA